MKLFRIISNAQGGQIFLNMGQVFGLSDEMVAQAVRYFLPPIEKVIARRSESVDGLISVLEFLGSRRCDRAMADPRIFREQRVADEGQRILLYLFGKGGHVRKLIDNRARALQIDPEILEWMLPYIAVLAIGALEVRTRRPLGTVLHRLARGSLEPHTVLNPYVALAKQVKLRHEAMAGLRQSRVTGFLGSLFGRSSAASAA